MHTTVGNFALDNLQDCQFTYWYRYCKAA